MSYIVCPDIRLGKFDVPTILHARMDLKNSRFYCFVCASCITFVFSAPGDRAGSPLENEISARLSLDASPGALDAAAHDPQDVRDCHAGRFCSAAVGVSLIGLRGTNTRSRASNRGLRLSRSKCPTRSLPRTAVSFSPPMRLAERRREPDQEESSRPTKTDRI